MIHESKILDSDKMFFFLLALFLPFQGCVDSLFVGFRVLCVEGLITARSFVGFCE